MVTATHKGSANFVISALDENNEWISSLDKAPALDLPVKQEGDKVYIYNLQRGGCGLGDYQQWQEQLRRYSADRSDAEAHGQRNRQVQGHIASKCWSERCHDPERRVLDDLGELTNDARHTALRRARGPFDEQNCAETAPNCAESDLGPISLGL
jgi:hypothetical protein